jgi:hypothetical protein
MSPPPLSLSLSLSPVYILYIIFHFHCLSSQAFCRIEIAFLGLSLSQWIRHIQLFARIAKLNHKKTFDQLFTKNAK